MTKVGGAPIPQSIVTPKKAVSAPKVAPVSETSAPSKTSSPSPSPVVQTQSESSLVEDTATSSSPTDVKVKSSFLKSMEVDVLSDLDSSEPVSDLKSSQKLFSKAISALKDKFKEITSFPLFKDGMMKADPLMGRLFSPEASFKDKILGLALRDHTVKEFSTENPRFLDALRGVSEMEPGAEQDQALTTIYEKFVPDGSREMINISHNDRNKLTEFYPTFTAAKEAYASDPSEENLMALNEARTVLTDKLTACVKPILRLMNESNARFVRGTALKDMTALLDGDFSATKEKSLGKAFYLEKVLITTAKGHLRVDSYAQEKGFTTTEQLQDRKKELSDQIKTLRFGSSTMDKIKGAFGKPDVKVLTGKEVEQLKSLINEQKRLFKTIGGLEEALEARTKELDKNIQKFNEYQVQIASPDFLSKLTTDPLND